MRPPTDNLPSTRRAMLVDTDALEVIPELQPVDQDTQIYKRFLSGFSHNGLDYTICRLANRAGRQRPTRQGVD